MLEPSFQQPPKNEFNPFLIRFSIFIGSLVITFLSLAQTSITNDITTNTTWNSAGSPYSIDQFGGISVDAGVTLTIDPGVTVTFANNNNDLTVNGTLIADGGPGLDTIRFQDNLATVFLSSSSTGSIIDHARFESMGVFNFAALHVSSDATITNSKFVDCEVGVTTSAGASPTIQDCEMFSSIDYGILVDSGSPNIIDNIIDGDDVINSAGIWIQAGTPSITGCTFQNTEGVGAIHIDQETAPILNTNTFINNIRDITTHPLLLDDSHYDNNTGISVIHVDPKNITSNTTWHKPQLPESWVYEMAFGDVTVEAGNTLTIEPGVEVVYAFNNQNLFVDGILNAVGTPTDSIRFRDGFATIDIRAGSGPNTLNYIRMDRMGAFNVSGLVLRSSNTTVSNSKFVDNEVGITVDGGSSPSIQDCDFFSNTDYGIRVSDGSPTIDNVEIDGDNAVVTGGIRIITGTPSITNSIIENTGSAGAVLVESSNAPVLDGNTFMNNAIDLLAHPMTLDDTNYDNNGLSVIHVINTTITANTTWHQPVLPESWYYQPTGVITVNGGATLTIEPGVEMQFTSSAHDITVNGTLDASGTDTEPIHFNGGGASIVLSSSSTGSTLDYVRMDQMGASNEAGLAISSDATVTNSYFDQCERGISVANSASPIIQNSQFTDSNDFGIVVTSGTPTISNNAIFNNPTGLTNTSGVPITATNNWWGDPSGPTHASNPTGTGDIVTDDVTFSPFLLTNPLANEAPTDLFTTEVSDSQIDLTWADNSSNETGFTIERSVGNNSSWSTLTTRGVDATSHSDNSVTVDNGYFYRVIANGTFNDSSPSNEKFGSTITSPGNALQFDGTDDLVTVSHTTELQISANVTLSAWVKRNDLDNTDVILEKGGDWNVGETNYAMALQNQSVNNGMFYFYWDGGFRGADGVLDLDWHHYAAVATEGNADPLLYIDGVLQTIQYTGGASTITLNETSTRDLHIGAQNDPFPVILHSSLEIDELSIWSEVKTAPQIVTLVATPPSGNEANLVAYYRFDQDQTSDLILPDRSTNNNEGTWSGAGSGATAPQWVASGAMPSEISVYQGSDNTGTELFTNQVIPVNYGNAPQSTTLPLEFAIENVGVTDLVITDINTSGDFSVTTSTSFTVTPNSIVNFTVELLALSPGIANGTITIESNDIDEPSFTFPVTGTKGIIPQKVYWTDETGTQDDEIDRADRAGANAQNAYYSGFSVDIQGIDVDTENNMVFWTNTDGQIRCGRIGDAGFVGTNTVLDESGGSARPFRGVAVDGAAGKVYWCDDHNGQIRRIDFDGSNDEILFSASNPQDIELDVANGKMYYSDGQDIFQANMDGSGSPVSIYNGGSWPQFGLALDLTNDLMFWIEDDEGIYTIYKADLDGMGLSGINFTGNTLIDIECDPDNQRIYITDDSNNEIVSLDYDGGDQTVVEGAPIVTEPIYLALDVRQQLSGGVILSDYQALEALYNSTDGANWTDNTNWLNGDVDTWNGITTVGDRVTEIRLNSNNLVGTIPSEFQNLSELTYLSFQDNILSGSIPIFWSGLTNLTHLSLDGNQFTGSIPTELGLLTNLDFLDLDRNMLTGTVPVELTTLTNLTQLRFDENQLTGTLDPDFGNLTGLTHFEFNDNMFTGVIPSTYTNLINLQFFNIGNNSFEDLPDMSGITSFVAHRVNGNAFQFDDLEPNIGTGGFDYISQANVAAPADENLNEGDALNVTIVVGGSTNQYQWYKDGSPVSGQTTDNLLISSVVPVDAGSYHLELTNTTVTGLTISSDPFNVTVNGNPTVVAQDITVSLDATGNVSITPAQIDNGSSDDLTVAVNLILALDITDFDCTDTGANTVTLTVTDEDGNSANGTATVTVSDDQLPVATTQDITVSLDAAGNASILAAAVDNGSSDNCSVSSVILDITDFDCTDIGANTVTLTATDAEGNSSNGTATVTVIDDIDPVVVAQDIMVTLDASNQTTITPADIDNGSSDNCTYTLSLDVTSFGLSEVGDNTVTLTATDGSGNSANTTAIVTVLSNNQAPTFSYILYIDENSPNGTMLGAIVATDPEGDPLSYTILSGNTNNAFAIDASTGELIVNSSEVLDFETTPVFNLMVQASDGNGGISIVDITINVNDIIDENPLGFADPEDQIIVYPNPAHQRLYIEIQGVLSNNLEVELFTMSGSQVLSNSRILSQTSELIELDLGELNPGMYLLRISHEYELITKHVLVK